jgi:hypothetical protein
VQRYISFFPLSKLFERFFESFFKKLGVRDIEESRKSKEESRKILGMGIVDWSNS